MDEVLHETTEISFAIHLFRYFKNNEYISEAKVWNITSKKDCMNNKFLLFTLSVFN